MAAYLVPIDPGLCVIPLEKAILLIGRQADCDVSLTASRKISRKHCCIAIVNETVIVRDLGSTNGVSINGSRIDREAHLRLGYELTIGDVRFRLQREATPQARPQQQMPIAVPQAERRQEYATPARAPIPAPVSMDFPVALADEALQSPVLVPAHTATQKTASDYDFVDAGPLVPPYQATASDFVPLRSDSF
jgi:pSer/pThr/pTyr-binding forkhead associated (FHA) protein